jgi:hypothetical protein
MALLALQFGIQPILVRKFTPQTINRSSVVLIQEVVKFGIAGSMYWAGTGKEKRVKDFEGWSIKTWITLAGLPAFLYTIQNISSLMAYQNLEALTFNVLNQTKILSAALSCYFVMGKRQSKMQVVSLLLLTLSTLVIEKILHLGSIASLERRWGRWRSVWVRKCCQGYGWLILIAGCIEWKRRKTIHSWYRSYLCCESHIWNGRSSDAVESTRRWIKQANLGQEVF